MAEGAARVLEVMGPSAGGVARHVAEITTGLDGAQGFEIDIAGPGDLPVPLPKRPFRVAIPGGARGHLGAIWNLRRLASGYDLVHAHGTKAGADSALATLGLRVPLVVTIHNLVRADFVGRLRVLFHACGERVAMRSATCVIAPSDEIAHRLRAYRKNVRIEVVHLWPGDVRRKRRRKEVRAGLSLSGDQRLLVTVSRLAPQKDLPTMLRALRLLPANVVLGIVGDGAERPSLERMARAFGVGDRAMFLGFKDDAVDYVSAADVFCLSSLWEARALAAQEAILLGVPVVATNVGGMPELLEDGVSGRLVPSRDPGALAAALSEVLSSPEAARGLARVAAERLGERSSREGMLARIAGLYGSMT